MSLENDDPNNEKGDVAMDRKKKAKVEVESSDEEMDVDNEELLAEFDVKVAAALPNTEAFTIQFPTRKTNVFDGIDPPKARFKNHVKLLEFRIPSSVHSGSYDKEKAKVLMPQPAQAGQMKFDPYGSGLKEEDIFEGRAFQTQSPVINVFGQIKDGSLLICPLSGTFEMRKSLAHLNAKKVKEGGKGAKDDPDMLSDDSEDADQTGASGPRGSAQQQAIRVKFSKPETERQKKRREASALHRERLIASDVWVDMQVHGRNNPYSKDCTQKMQSLAGTGINGDSMEVDAHSNRERRGLQPDLRRLVQDVIIKAKGS
ncbi:hypothetical protein WR25_21557 [Diploscapter pachys]|uniref:Uncharacterized protein n=1 Tax=Diploscapter pachys TaxID=2018661 RepID=A0A2A2JNN6_9BILA|nr:hypothetical protein WR25_21557 [Diploscapter pachys]